METCLGVRRYKGAGAGRGVEMIKMLCKLGCFQDLVIMSEISINICVDISVWQEVFISFPLLNTKECDH